MSFVTEYLAEVVDVSQRLDAESIERCVDVLVRLRARNGRLFVLGVGGSAANASHAVNDFRKIAGIQAYAPTDNVAELTARTNDDGWSTTFEEWLKVSQADLHDALMILSVGGGTPTVSPNIAAAVTYAANLTMPIIGIVGRDGGYTAHHATVSVIIPASNHVTQHSEEFQSIIWHLLVSHPRLRW